MTPASGPVDRALLLTGADVLWARDALRELERRARVNGAGAPARLRHLLALVEPLAAVISASGRTESEGLADLPLSAADSEIDSQEAADMLECGDRNVRIQCASGRFATARKVGNRWRIARAEVLAIVEQRAGR